MLPPNVFCGTESLLSLQRAEMDKLMRMKRTREFLEDDYCEVRKRKKTVSLDGEQEGRPLLRTRSLPGSDEAAYLFIGMSSAKVEKEITELHGSDSNKDTLSVNTSDLDMFD